MPVQVFADLDGLIKAPGCPPFKRQGHRDHELRIRIRVTGESFNEHGREPGDKHKPLIILNFFNYFHDGIAIRQGRDDPVDPGRFLHACATQSFVCKGNATVQTGHEDEGQVPEACITQAAFSPCVDMT